ncbi:MAG: GNAT family N-acetyltransferase [Deltaproteobacteria bacterium]|nr:GNAT family N-acetyltransferase [Deltaproteobacteria bacterium]
MSGGRYGKYGEIQRLQRLRRSGPPRSGPESSPSDRPARRNARSTAPRVHIREARPLDRTFVSRLSGRAFRRFGSYTGVIRDWFDSGAALTLLAVSEGRPAGFAMTAQTLPTPAEPPETELLAIAVDSGVRRSGIGRRLLREIEAAAREGGADVIRLHTATDNLAARSLFEGEGFRVLGLQRRFYPCGQDALLMIKGLADKPS